MGLIALPPLPQHVIISLSCAGLHSDPFDLVEADLVLLSVIELRRAGAGMISHRGGVFQRAAVLQVGGDPGRPEAMVADPGADAGCQGASLHHETGIGLGAGEFGSAGRCHGRWCGKAVPSDPG